VITFRVVYVCVCVGSCDYDLGRRWTLAGLVVSGKRFSSLYCVDVGALLESVERSWGQTERSREAMWEVQDFKLEEVELGCRGRWGLPAVSPTVFHHLHHHHFRPSSFIIISHLKQGHNIDHISSRSLCLTLTSGKQKRNIMATKLLIKLEKQWGKIDSQRDEVDSLHRIVSDVIQHGEDIGALKAENTP
jgi:hypothetical protein